MSVTSQIDLRSDTAIQPTPAMLEAIQSVQFRDDLLREDKSTNALVEMTCDVLGTADAVITPSGTMSNQIAVMALTSPGEEVILGPASHVRNLEGAGLAANAGVQIRCIPVDRGIYDTDALAAALRTSSLQVARTGLISLEATYDLNSGFVTPIDNYRDIRRLADHHEVPVFLDGARLFNSAHALGVDPAEITQHVDAVQFCLNKGLGAPLGSMLAGSKEFIEHARRLRQRLGGGMRHTGLLAAPGLIALAQWRDTIAADHLAAQRVAERLGAVPGLAVVNGPIETNIVSLSVDAAVMPVEQFIGELAGRGVHVKRIADDRVRLVTHRSATAEHLEMACDVIEQTVRPR
ncbi:aminotransferase class I/II-fold pyridoxal phosphate-dependent enzyme [Ornithinimicrobium faecis]|uniref:Aminotransferase class I/II-fold pyridoxal phosphate-dependent enzyme n=1 Tax=Ornithinimicrobium faecis TaxID=2934158 RepID=A0ABY4YV83_9MICO|nr:GntG family PLP-dependent aldolase [Ornithinimicrobium sp. HY1793]USQ80464.1 aminotransferase class I/II-fold pyridoxal phosphate-dependent enzyme [Ornithinimicrobium sp. HY1793]